MSPIRFQSVAEADAFLAPRLDVPVAIAQTDLGGGVVLRTDAVPLPGGRFTNRYRLSWQPGQGRVCFTDERRSVPEFAAAHPALVAVSTGGFFFLADDCDVRPRCLSLNLAVDGGRVRSLPEVDQEALIGQDLSLIHI